MQHSAHRRPVRAKIHQPVRSNGLGSKILNLARAKSRVDVIAQQVLDHDDNGIFEAIRANDDVEALRLIDTNPEYLQTRDSVGAAPIHIAFLFGHYELGKRILQRARHLATLTYTSFDPENPSVYEGENILHIAIVHRQFEVANWLIQEVPGLLATEATGKFFSPGKPCYFGGYPLLFAFASNQIDIARRILKISEGVTSKQAPSDRHGSVRYDSIVGKVEGAAPEPKTSIFTCDSHGNNALHLAVIHNLPEVYNFALRYAMRELGGESSCIDTKRTPRKSISANETNEDKHETPREHDKAEGESTNSQAYTIPELAHPEVHSTTEVDPIPKLPLSPLVTPKENADTKEKVNGEESDEEDDESHLALFAFLKTASDSAYPRMLGFLMQRNKDELTPLSLAAAIGNEAMFRHLLNLSASLAWSYGPIRAVNIPILDLEQPMIRDEPRVEDDVSGTLLGLLRAGVKMLPYPLAPKGTQSFPTALQCLCSVDRVSNIVPAKMSARQEIITRRLEILKVLEVKQLLHKKWKYVGKRRFMARLIVYAFYLFLLNITMLFRHDTYTNGYMASRVFLGLAEACCLGVTVVKFTNECSQMIMHWRAYLAEAGAGRLDNICTVLSGSSFIMSVIMRSAGFEDAEDGLVAITLIFSWFYMLFFLMGFRSTGPFVIMILRMIANDIIRFMFVYGAVMLGFAQAVYVIQDSRSGLRALLHRIRMLAIAAFTGEINYDDNYTSGRMNTFTQLLMLAYVLLVMILLVNLLIAMMGNTYTEVLQEAEQRWVAERANIMSTIENQCPSEWNDNMRHKYAIPLQGRMGIPLFYLQVEIDEMETWKNSGNHDKESNEGFE